ncbi:unnamed protein product [Protopolystoma xenopodis]|uniref:Uncharacterized protein n=1 Tax=Protopolystoma xenopodis TaxID=117903 RepID=A0A3S4ZXL7_9PLAT|nr:unnamed protein product [Protopolystoma xenopodis]
MFGKLRQPEHRIKAKRLQYNGIQPSSSGEINLRISSSCTLIQNKGDSAKSTFWPSPRQLPSGYLARPETGNIEFTGDSIHLLSSSVLQHSAGLTTSTDGDASPRGGSPVNALGVEPEQAAATSTSFDVLIGSRANDSAARRLLYSTTAAIVTRRTQSARPPLVASEESSSSDPISPSLVGSCSSLASLSDAD